MSRYLILIYGVIAYLIGMAGLFYFFLFVGGWDFLPIHVDSPGPLVNALLINTGLIALFAVQHTIMARQGFKEGLTRLIPKAAERSTFVLVSGIIMLLICYFWQAINGTVWHVENRIGSLILIILHILGWVIAVLTSFIINHFELFGLQQVYLNFVNKPMPPHKFTDRLFYKIVRHPLQFGLLVGMWFTPTMSMTHLSLSVLFTIYIFIGLQYEEKDLVKFLGQDYQNYQKRVPMVLPIPKS